LQAEDGIRDRNVTGVQTCALPIYIYDQKINPKVPIPNRITALTGLSDEDVKDSPTFEEVAPDIFKLLKNRVFIAHNVNFDLTFLNREFKRIGMNQLNVKAIEIGRAHV